MHKFLWFSLPHTIHMHELDLDVYIASSNLPNRYLSINHLWTSHWCILTMLWIYVTVIVLLWLLHQKGFFDPLYDWWDDRFMLGSHRRRTYSKHGKEFGQSRTHAKYDQHLARHNDGKYHLNMKRKRQSSHSHHVLHKNHYPDVYQHKLDHHHRLHVHKARQKHRHGKGNGNAHDSLKAIKIHGDKHKRHTHGHNRIHELHAGYNSEEEWLCTSLYISFGFCIIFLFISCVVYMVLLKYSGFICTYYCWGSWTEQVNCTLFF